MINGIDFLPRDAAVLQLREMRSTLIASNIANADTPNYAARDINFQTSLDQALSSGNVSAKPQYLTSYPVGLNGNDVSLTGQKIEAIQNNSAMTAEVTFLHQSTSDLLTALRPNPNGI